MLYAGHTLAQIAGYDDVQMAAVVCRRRNRYGQLVRPQEALPAGVEVDEDGMRVVRRPVAYATMYQQLKRQQGLSAAEIKASWADFLSANPKLGKGGIYG